MQAQESNTSSNSDWDIVIGGGVGVVPIYEGSDNYTVIPAPNVHINWKDTISFGLGGLNVTLLNARNFKAGIGLTYHLGRDENGDTLFGNDEDDTLRGMGDIDSALGVRAFAAYEFTPVTLSSSITQYFGDDHNGLLIDAALSKGFSIKEKLILTPSIKMTWANSDYMETFFGVSAIQSVRSQFTQFNAESGLKDVSLGLNAMYLVNNDWSILANAQLKHFLSDAEDSPISQEGTNGSLFLAINYRF